MFKKLFSKGNVGYVRYQYLRDQPWAVKALERDGFQCVDCNSTLSLVVHHLDGGRRFGYRNMNNKLTNLVTVCRQCHAKRHSQGIAFKNPNTSLIKELREQGKTYREIGDYLGISRQRVHQILAKLPP